MNRKPWIEASWTLALLVVATTLIAVTGSDLAVSSTFCIDGKWPLGELFPWKALYRLDRIPAIAVAFAGLVLLVISFWRPDKSIWKRRGAFLVLLLALGPGLLVNSIFKEHWGRPRPREIVQFGGKKEFLHPWQKGISGNGRSFPSGHASAAFYMTAPYFIYRHSRKRLAYAWLAGGLFFGLLMSIARISQGGHFLSDNLWAWGMVHLCAITLAALLKLDRVPTTSSPTTAP
jgi:lipid A 4'-phosphatase